MLLHNLIFRGESDGDARPVVVRRELPADIHAAPSQSLRKLREPRCRLDAKGVAEKLRSVLGSSHDRAPQDDLLSGALQCAGEFLLLTPRSSIHP